MLTLTLLQNFLCVVSGAVVGFSLGLIGGGGSILAVPLLVYLVGLDDPHLAIGTTALAVGLTAFYSLLHHHRSRNVRWGVASRFAAAGVIGALLGSALGKAISGKHLLFLFALLMLVVAIRMMSKEKKVDSTVPIHGYGRTYGYGALVGVLSGFFGIGGGFLIVPALMRSNRMPILNAIGSSLVAVGAFGVTTAASYAWSGLIDWQVSAEYIAGGVLGGWIGTKVANHLGQKKAIMRYVFGIIVILVAVYMLIMQLTGSH